MSTRVGKGEVSKRVGKGELRVRVGKGGVSMRVEKGEVSMRVGKGEVSTMVGKGEVYKTHYIHSLEGHSRRDGTGQTHDIYRLPAMTMPMEIQRHS